MTGQQGPVSLGFEIRFHQWFRVGDAFGLDGLDAAVDRDDPLPGEHLKGLMRLEAEGLAAAGLTSDDLVEAVFGTPALPSPWTWTGAEPTTSWQFSARHRVAIDDATGTALKDAFVAGEVAGTREPATFSIVQIGAVDAAARVRHVALLTVSAASVHHIGAWRRRGLGWVDVTPLGGPVTRATIAQLAGEAQ